MKLEIQQREKEGVIILDLQGRLVLGEEDSALRQRLTDLLDSGRNNVILNLREVTDVDSASLGTLVLFSVRCRDAGGKMVLLDLTKGHTRLSDLLKLNAAFETYDDEVAAINSFFPDRAVQRYDILDFVEEQERRR